MRRRRKTTSLRLQLQDNVSQTTTARQRLSDYNCKTTSLRLQLQELKSGSGHTRIHACSSARTHTHTHTHILMSQFEDRETTGLKVDIANFVTETSSATYLCSSPELRLKVVG